jgi:hypothetical protein
VLPCHDPTLVLRARARVVGAFPPLSPTPPGLPLTR